MLLPRQFTRRLRAIFLRSRVEREMHEEMRFHLDMRAEENRADGLAPGAADQAARRKFGNVGLHQENCRDHHRLPGLDHLVRDVRFALRSLLKTPGFTVISVLTLAMGIGLNTAMFSLMNTLLLRPLPFAEATQLIRLHRTTPREVTGPFSPADYRDLKAGEADFGRFAAYYRSTLTVSSGGQPAESLNVMRVSAEFFDVLGVRPQLGRSFRPEEETEGNHHVVLLSHAFWQDRLGGATDALSHTLRADGETYEIIGILPASANDHRIFGQIGLFIPLGLDPGARAARDARWLSVLGRREHLSASRGAAFVADFGARLAADFPAENAGSGWRAEGLRESTMNPRGRALLFMLLGLSGFVLLIACSNLANFQLARTIERTRELAVRAALGASRLQLIRPIVVESMVLALAGGASALLVSAGASRWLSSEIVQGGGPSADFALDWRVLGFAVGASVLTVLGFGLAPAWFALRLNTNEALKSGGARGATAGPGHQRFRHTLIIGQFALALMLLAGAGFFVRGSDYLLRQEHGWTSDRVVQGSLQLASGTYSVNDAVQALHRRLLEQVRQIPGVQSASLSHALPYLGLKASASYVTESGLAGPRDAGWLAQRNDITPSYFAVTGTRLIAGRSFEPADTESSPRVVIVSEAMARSLFPGLNPLGRRIAPSGGPSQEWAEIVGVVADVRSVDVTQDPPRFQLYRPMAQAPARSVVLAVRTDGLAPESVVKSLRAAVAAVDGDLPLRDLMPANVLIERTTSQMNIFRKLLAGLSALGVLLAGLGLYGVIARTVVQRTSELGIRMALGAGAHDVIRLILKAGVRLATTGAAIGALGAFGLLHVISAALPGMQADGALVLTAAAVLLGLIALAAGYLPARRASRISPLVALRAD